jgi:hypothetical protein
MPMKRTIPPTFESAHETLGTVLLVIRQALERGTAHVQEYCDWQDESIDRCLAPSLVRHKAKAYLRERRQDVTDEPGYKPEQLANNGLCLRTSEFSVRILKSENGCIPPPGPSQARNKFYSQQLPLPGMEDEMEEASPWGVIVHWTVSDDYNLVMLGLSLPKSGGNDSSPFETYWDKPFWVRPQVLAHPPVRAVDLDIPFELREADDGIRGTDTTNDIRRQGETGAGAERLDSD